MPYHLETARPVNGDGCDVVDVAVVERGPLRAVVAVSFSLPVAGPATAASTVLQHIVMTAGSAVLEFECQVLMRVLARLT